MNRDTKQALVIGFIMTVLCALFYYAATTPSMNKKIGNSKICLMKSCIEEDVRGEHTVRLINISVGDTYEAY